MKKTVDAYATLHAQARAGLLGKQGSARRIKALGKPIMFGPWSAQPFDDRMLSWRHDARTVSIWTVSGRLRDVAFTGEPGQLDLRAKLRAKLQAKGTKSAKRLLKKRRRKESRHVADVNHCISKRIVAEAERTGRGIALEDLSGIRERARFRRPQRATLHSWAFRQLGGFIDYQARQAGVPVVHVNPAYTSQECAECHDVDKCNRPSRAMFACRSCGVVAHADRNASRVIARRGVDMWMAGRESRVPAPRKERSDAGGNAAASRALPANSAL